MIKRLFLCFAIGVGVLCTPSIVIAQPEPAAAVDTGATDADTGEEADADEGPAVPNPSDPKEVAESVGSLIDATRTGSWITIAGAVIMLLMNLFRLPMLGSLTKKIPKRWRIVIPIALGGIAGVLASIAGGVPWYEAIAVGLFSGPTAVFAHESVAVALFGKRAKSAGSNA